MRAINELKITARMRAKERLLEILYLPPKEYMRLRLQEIVKKNNMAHKDGKIFGGIIYKGRTFDVKPIGYYVYAPDYLLDPGLEEEFENYLEDRQEISNEQVTMTRFLSILFSNVNNGLDLEDFLGRNLYDQLSEFHRYFIGERLENREMMEFTQKYRLYSEQMNNRMVENLLAKDLYDIT